MPKRRSAGPAIVLSFAPPRPKMSEESKARLRAVFGSERLELLGQIQRLKEPAEETDQDDLQRREILDLTYRRVATIDFALERIREENYGFCQTCTGEPREIEEGKLLATPRTTTCRKCDDTAFHGANSRLAQQATAQALAQEGTLFKPQNKK